MKILEVLTYQNDVCYPYFLMQIRKKPVSISFNGSDNTLLDELNTTANFRLSLQPGKIESTFVGNITSGKKVFSVAYDSRNQSLRVTLPDGSKAYRVSLKNYPNLQSALEAAVNHNQSKH